METITQQVPGPSRRRGRRESKVAYRNHPGSSGRSSNGGTSYTSQSPEQTFSRPTHVDHSQYQGQVPDQDLRNYLNVHRSSAGSASYVPIVHQNIPEDNSWLSMSISSANSYTLNSNLPSSPRNSGGSHGQASRKAVPQVSGTDQDQSWNGFTPQTSNAGSVIEDVSMSDMGLESFDSFGNMLFPAPNTTASSSSHGYVFPHNTSFNPTGSPTQLQDLTLPGKRRCAFQVSLTELSSLLNIPAHLPELNADHDMADQFHQIGQIYAPSSPGSANLGSPVYASEDFHFDGGFSPVSPGWDYNGVYPTGNTQWSSTTVMPNQAQDMETVHANNSLPPNTPWNSQIAQHSNYQMNANSGHVTFEPYRGTTYQTHLQRQDFLDTRQDSKMSFGPEPVSPTSDNGANAWAIVSCPSSYAASHGSPVSNHSPQSHASSPPQQELEQHHTHIFNSIQGPPKAKPLRGRQRGLTAAEKKQARDVREAKACWACHISKTKVGSQARSAHTSADFCSAPLALQENHASNVRD